MTALLAAFGGAALLCGLTLAVLGVRGTTAPAPIRRPHALRRQVEAFLHPGEDERARRQRRLLGSVALFVVALVVTHLPIVAAAVAVGVVYGPSMLPRAAASNRSIDRVEALAEWLRRLTELLSSGHLLQSAILESRESCPVLLRPSVQRLSDRINARYPIEPALHLWADELADRDADLIASVMIVNLYRGGALGTTLTGLANSLTSQLRRRRDIEADRSKPRQSARMIAVIYAVVIVLGGLFAGDYLAPYRTPVGQVVLAVILGMFFGCLLMMRAITATPVPRRLLTRTTRRVTKPGLMSGLAPLRPVVESRRTGP